MPKYTDDIVAGYTLYFTSKCTIEAMHVHASDKRLAEDGSAKLWVYSNGDTKVEKYGSVSPKDMVKIQKYIKNNFMKMYEKWKKHGGCGFYEKR